IENDYIFGEKLGFGRSGVCWKVLHKTSGGAFAVKSIDTSKVKKTKRLLKELTLLSSLQHPNIMILKEAYYHGKWLHMVSPLYSGGELFDKIHHKFKHFGSFPEDEVAGIIYQLLDAVAYLHEHGIMHRDLKPENLMFSDSSPQARVKLIDFGMATTFDPKDRSSFLESLCGTAYYIAPEVITKRYRNEADVWSIGVITYAMVYGHAPFDAETDQAIFHLTCRAPLRFPRRRRDGAPRPSPEAEAFIASLLRKDPRRRPAA
ncbi:unnamed protein product, partial [Heterosigma akashiwo]